LISILMSQIMTPDEIQNAAENLKAAFAAGAISAREFDDGMTDVTKGVKGYTAELNASLNQLGTATKKLGEGLLQGQQGMAQYNDLTASAGDAAAKAAAQFGPLGMAVGAIIKVITFGISEVTKMSDGLYKANQDLAKSGAAGAEGMTGVFDNMQKFGYGIAELGEMSALIANNSNSLALLGGTVEQGTKQFANVASGIKNSDLQRQFMNMGMSVNDINTGIAGYISMQAQLGIESSQTTEQMTAGAAAYLEQQDKLTKITGQNADQLKNNQAKAQQIESFSAKLAGMAPEEAAKMQAGFDMLMKTSETAALGFAASVTGMVGLTKESSQTFQATGGASARLSKQFEENIKAGMDSTKAAAIMTQGFADATAKNKGLANSMAMVGGDAGMGKIQEINRMSALAGGKALDAAAAAETAQDKQKEGADKNTNEHTKMLQEQMATRDSFQTLISKGIGPVTEGFSALSKTINKILGFIPGSGVPLGGTRQEKSAGGGGATMAAPMPAAGGDMGAIMSTIKTRESGGDYKAQAKGSSASGAYQFIDSTWQSLTRKSGIGTEYKRAIDAPPEIQDAIAKHHIADILKKADGDISKVPVAWYTGNIQGKMSQEAVAKNNGLTAEKYQEKWLADFAKQRGTTEAPATTGAPGYKATDLASAQNNMPTAKAKDGTNADLTKGQASLTPYQEQMLAEKRRLTAATEAALRAEQVVPA
jgi:resuscitation-promoting factor RpfA